MLTVKYSYVPYMQAESFELILPCPSKKCIHCLLKVGKFQVVVLTLKFSFISISLFCSNEAVVQCNNCGAIKRFCGKSSFVPSHLLKYAILAVCVLVVLVVTAEYVVQNSKKTVICVHYRMFISRLERS